MAADELTTGTGVEESDYALIAETEMNPAKSARNGSTYEDVPRLESTSGSRRPLQPVPRKSTKDTQFAMHPVHELYTTPDESQLSNGHRDSIPEYAVSQKFRKEPISQTVPQAPPSALGPEDINGLYTMPDKSRNTTKAKKVLDSDMDIPAGIDNASYICRGEDDLQEGETPNEYATDKDGMGGEDESDDDTGMVENDMYDTSHRPTGGDTGMVENDLYETSYRLT
ncbi:uncharacterized protein LOC105438296 [Strongylocentrotus purpuratus]|uniref:Uncharacterized protein n=1 Tax=Strongylocentrotus purpuratus TaxID=7668 RepID=A0A7M7NP92_STRPU|nr:uncharacterized protein LOC105438296 [Strongylocentrotus purpuratus]